MLSFRSCAYADVDSALDAILGGYAHAPGLRLTCEQACQLWDLNDAPNAQPPAGQTPPAGSTQPANPSDTREQKAQTDRTTQTLTVVGCVAPASSQAGAGATTGAQTGQRGAGYILTNVTAAGSTPGGAGRTAGTSGTPASGTTLASSYRLMSGPDQDCRSMPVSA